MPAFVWRLFRDYIHDGDLPAKRRSSERAGLWGRARRDTRYAGPALAILRPPRRPHRTAAHRGFWNGDYRGKPCRLLLHRHVFPALGSYHRAAAHRYRQHVFQHAEQHGYSLMRRSRSLFRGKLDYQHDERARAIAFHRNGEHGVFDDHRQHRHRAGANRLASK